MANLDSEKIISQLSKDAIKKIKKIKMPNWVDPMLATLTDKYFDSEHYLYEHKWDGERILAFKNGKKVSLLTRNKKSATNIYPTIVKMLEEQHFNKFIIDGEVIAISNGKSDFSLLQKRMHSENSLQNNINICFYVFDIIYFDKYDLTNLELIDRKKLLEQVIGQTEIIKLTEYIIKSGIKYYNEACKLGWEGIIAKNIHSSYESKRSRNWLKFKCLMQQEFVIGGYTEPEGRRPGFGALLLGYYKNNDLIYVGKVGTGFDDHTLYEISRKLSSIEQKKSSFKEVNIPTRGIHWVKPNLVAEIKFSQWTSYDKLRHARFMGLREDKNPKEVVKEQPK